MTVAQGGEVEARCPDLAALENVPLSREIRDHVDRCPSCRLVVDVFADGPALDECLRFDALLAARGDGTLNSAGKNLLERHLASCESCRAVAETLSPMQDAQGDHATLPKVDPTGYALGLEVARGGMGRIIAARDLRVGRPVAVKELLGRSPHLAARFEREARVTARLQHPGIVPIYEIGRWPDGTPFYTMRMVDGRTLRAAIERATTLPDRIALLPAVLAACEAVAFAHSQRVIHRDLTPSNVLVGAYGETVVIDWGLAKDLSEGRRDDDPIDDPYRSETSRASADGLTGVGAVVGTLAYMPPEQANAESVDERSDVYALGAILYHLLAGAPPYRSRTTIDLLEDVKAGPPPAIETIAPRSPRDLVSIVTKAMARSPDARYPSARELAEELKRFLTGRIVEAHQYSQLELIRRFIQRNRAAVMVAVLAAVVLVSVGSVFVNRILRSSREAQDTARDLVLEKGRIELLAGEPLRALAYLNEAYQAGARGPAIEFLLASALSDIESSRRTLDCGGDARAVDLRERSSSPRLTHLAAACHNVGQIWHLETGTLIADLKASDGKEFAGGFDGILYSHDGATVATWGEDGVARLWDAKSGLLRHSYKHGAPITFTTFTPDDEQIATTGDDGYARIWNVSSPQQPIQSIQGSDDRFVRRLFGVLTPDGQRLLTVTFAGSGRAWALDGNLLDGFEHGTGVVGGSLSADGSHAVTCDLKGVAKIWDAKTPTDPVRLAGHTDVVWRCIFSPDGRRVLTTSHDGTAKVWDANTGALLISVNHDDVIWLGSFSSDGRRFVTIGVSGRAKVWDSSSGSMLSSHDSRRGKDARFSNDGHLVVLRGDERIEVWGLPSTRRSSFEPPPSASLVAVTMDGQRIATRKPVAEDRANPGWNVTADDKITLWTVAGQQLPAQHPEIRIPIAASSGRFIAATPTGIMVIEATTGTIVRLISPRFGRPHTLAITADGRRIVAVTKAPTDTHDVVEIWDADRGELLVTLEGARRALLSDDGGRALSWSDDDESTPADESVPPVIWDVDAKRPVATLAVSKGHRPIGFSGGTRVALLEHASKAPHAVSLWDTASGALVIRQQDTNAFPTLDPTGRWLTTVGSDRIVTVRSTDDGTVLHTFPSEKLREAQASPDGSLVAGTDDHNRMMMIINTDGSILARWQITHPGPIVTEHTFNAPNAFAWWTPDSKSVVTLSTNVDVWNAANRHTPAKIAELIRKHVPWRVENGRLVLIQNGRLAGRVVRNQVPLANVKIRVAIRRPANFGTALNWESMKANVSTKELVTTEDGSFELDNLVPGDYSLKIIVDKVEHARDVFVSAEGDPVTIELPP